MYGDTSIIQRTKEHCLVGVKAWQLLSVEGNVRRHGLTWIGNWKRCGRSVAASSTYPCLELCYDIHACARMKAKSQPHADSHMCPTAVRFIHCASRSCQGTVKRSVDTHFIHANCDVDLIMEDGSPKAMGLVPHSR